MPPCFRYAFAIDAIIFIISFGFSYASAHYYSLPATITPFFAAASWLSTPMPRRCRHDAAFHYILIIDRLLAAAIRFHDTLPRHFAISLADTMTLFRL
jgi:hypothetical protein